MMEIMRLHYKNKHNQWCKRIDFDQTIRWYRNCKKIPIIGLTIEKKEVIQTKSIRKFIPKEKKDIKPTLRSALDVLKKKILTKQRSKTPEKRWYEVSKECSDFDSGSDDETSRKRSKEIGEA
jgi:hypothetical protein